jgi:hypothetical protein
MVCSPLNVNNNTSGKMTNNENTTQKTKNTKGVIRSHKLKDSQQNDQTKNYKH